MVEKIKIKVNGKSREIKPQTNLEQLLKQLEVNPEIAVVKLNEANVNKDQLNTTLLKVDDEVEFIFFMGGGSFDFTEEEIERYSRHLILEEIGGSGQQKIKQSRVLVVGAGGLGSPAAFYLAAAGVGKLGLVDSDLVDRTNLQRQILHTTANLERPKVESAREKLESLNPGIEIKIYNKYLNRDNIEDIIKDYESIVDAVDNFPTRYLINDACYFHNKILIEAGILKFSGQLMTIKPEAGPCYRCVFREPPAEGAIPSCQQAGVLGAVAGTIGTLQATEVLKMITGVGQPLIGRLLVYDALKLSFREVKIKKDENCPLCGKKPVIKELMEYELSCQYN